MGTLLVVATPIGNLEDITLRGIRTLAEADLLFAEDTRRTRVLLDRHRIEAHPRSLHEHNEAARIDEILEALGDEKSVALVSDAGTPLISDPGSRIVEAVIAAGHRVEAIPGPSAVSSALVVSGLPAAPFTFVGFLPRRSGACRSLLETYRTRPETLVFFESPQRLRATLAVLAEVLGERRASVARELTKLHEEVVRGTLGELVERFEADVRGEVTIVVEGCSEADAASAARVEELLDDAALDAAIREQLAAGRRPREIAAVLTPRTATPKRLVYARVLALKEAP